MINGIFLICNLILYLIVIIILNDVSSNIRVIATNITSGIMCQGFALISTYWSIKQYNKLHEPQNTKLKRYRSRTDSLETTSTDNHHHNLHQLNEFPNMTYLTLQDILSTELGFDLFANHLIKEFSIENLFFLFEIMQIKQQCINHKLKIDIFNM